ncbi:MAG: zinc-ribbon domain containing protein [Firmicutes bacterium]|nr:zinc-ribbon domain containing protein [Bacillota bacterium]MDH7494334.1 zinc-ribbon domain containing protein [Bacillota bacterium]
MYQDKTLVCRDCGREFTFTASEQEFFASKGFENEPGRCPECRAARKQASRGGRFGERQAVREMYPAVCSNCGAETTVPFKPHNDKPVYCSECFQSIRARR